MVLTFFWPIYSHGSEYHGIKRPWMDASKLTRSAMREDTTSHVAGRGDSWKERGILKMVCQNISIFDATACCFGNFVDKKLSHLRGGMLGVKITGVSKKLCRGARNRTEAARPPAAHSTIKLHPVCS